MKQPFFLLWKTPFFVAATFWNLSAAAPSIFSQDEWVKTFVRFYGRQPTASEIASEGEFSHSREFFSRAVPFFGLIYSLPLFTPSNQVLLAATTIGISLKTYVAGKWMVMYKNREATPLAVLVGLGDLSFAAIMLVFAHSTLPKLTAPQISSSLAVSAAVMGLTCKV